ncbi:SIR2 family protein [Candidatus Sulfurimonas baltica]|uniref:SIR2 family protein n=1 Tax=Candidatus Sulfurimonas baltica TaxID=2740404 RepID=A0A7S7LXA1_9BACT|nr:SIR2 family protein [Candidatus Sulfurimonas baltica]QOY53168.1 SIR2 family protein [Candidatus Sulfurimonas baltica]
MDNLVQSLKDGSLVPFVGMRVFENTKATDGSTLPYDSDSMILSLNSGRAMSSRLMYEYSRAAMSLEHRRGRDFIVQMTNHIYASKEYELPFTYEYFKSIQPKYMIDLNLDDSGCKIYEDIEHFMITGISRIMAANDRFVVYKYDLDKKEYLHVDKEELDDSIPILFKPLGCMLPDKNFIISDADFVDWLTEAMGGFAMPTFLKEYKKDKSYLFLGVDFSRDTYRMVANELTLNLKDGYVVSNKQEYSKKEKKFISAHNLQLIQDSTDEFLKAL